MALESEKPHTQDVDAVKIQTSASLAILLGCCGANFMMSNQY